MSHVPAVECATTPHAASRSGPLLRILFGAATLSAVAGVAAVTLLDRLVSASELPSRVSAPPVQTATFPVSAAAVGDTTVPDAATVFADRERAIEEPAPTF